jgi:hypothetical protein
MKRYRSENGELVEFTEAEWAEYLRSPVNAALDRACRLTEPTDREYTTVIYPTSTLEPRDEESQACRRSQAEGRA